LFKPHNIELYPIVSYVDLCSCGTQFEFLNLINTGAVVVVIAWWLDLQLPVLQSVPTTINVVSLNLVHSKVYSIQHYAINFVSDLQLVSCSPDTQYSSINKTDRHDITEILYSYIGTSFIQDSSLSRIWLRQISLYILYIIMYVFQKI
jgi:hypothetical protein